MKYKAVFLDIDDTLIGSDKTVSPGNLCAIRRAREAGVLVTIATGRGFQGSSLIWKEIDVQGPIIVYGGAMIKDTRTGETLFSADMEPTLIQEVLAAAAEWELIAQVYQGDTVLFERDNAFSQAYCKRQNLDFVIDPALREKLWRGVPKVLVYSPPALEAQMLKRFIARFEGRLEIASSHPGFIELNRFGVNKGTTLLRLAELLGIKIEETIAVGDNTLDIEMIRMAGLGVCVESGQQIVKDAADVIAPGCDDDGVKWVLDTYVLKEGQV